MNSILLYFLYRILNQKAATGVYTAPNAGVYKVRMIGGGGSGGGYVYLESVIINPQANYQYTVGGGK